jgi:enoyl-[acyl-carrier protein] reductase I
MFMPLDVTKQDELDAVFARRSNRMGQLDLFVHSIAWAPKDDLQGGCSTARRRASARRWTSPATPSSAWRASAPLMKDGGTMFTMSYYGANKVVPNYNVMGPVKAALEACARYLAYELGPQRIRVHADVAGAAARPAPHPASRTST